MNQEDLKNLTGWLQAIFKETQAARGAATELRHNVDMIPKLRGASQEGGSDNSVVEQRLEDAKNHLESQIRKLEDILNDMRHDIKDIHNKIDHLK